MRCYRRLFNISYKGHIINEEVRREIRAAIREYDEILILVKVWPRLIVLWFSKNNAIEHSERKQKKRWEDNIKQWTGMDFAISTSLRVAENRTRWNGKGLLQIHLWCPDDLPSLRDRIE